MVADALSAIDEDREVDLQEVLAAIADCRGPDGVEDYRYLDLQRIAIAAHAHLREHGLSADCVSAWPDMDSAVGGWRSGELTILGGRPSDGKSSLAMALVRAWATAATCAGYVSCEDPIAMVADRSVALAAGLATSRLRNPTDLPLDAQSRLQHDHSMGISERAWVADCTGARTSDVVQAMARLVHRRGCGALAVDYVQAIQPDMRSESRRHEVTAVARSIKAAAKVLGVPVVLCSQLRRPDKDSPGKPRMSHLRESGELEEMAENVLLLYRENEFDRALTVAKAKSAAPGVVLAVDWDRTSATVRAVTRRGE
jgi:replicative DNA helicase